MNKADLNSKYREYVKNNLSPTQSERDMVGKIYEGVRSALGGSCLMIGSYARFTAGRPPHDLDVLFVAGRFDPHHLRPQTVLAGLHSTLRRSFTNPTSYQVAISEQSHSITLSFREGTREIFAVDIVPAFTSDTKNEFGDDVYWVPEIIMVGKQKRQALYEELAKTDRAEREWWLKSDPRGYISTTTILNSANSDFRKATKLVKKWKHNCNTAHADFKLKSFHVEQVLFQIYSRYPKIEIADSIFEFFCALPNVIARPQIRDRADQARFIDQYLADLSDAEKQRIVEARDFFLLSLESLSESSSILDLLRGELRKRASRAEAYLFDSRIPVHLEPGKQLKIVANVLQREGGFRHYILDALGIISVDRKIRFEARVADAFQYDLLKWKVKNDDAAPEPRGEITDHTTRNNPESTRYKGSHFVECYAIRNGTCVARARQNVVLGSI